MLWREKTVFRNNDQAPGVLFSCSTPMRMDFQLLIKTKMLKIRNILAFKLSDVVFIMLTNFRMPAVVNTLSFWSTIQFMFSCVQHENGFITSEDRY